MGRRRRCGPDRAADREDELSECASLSRDEWGVVSNAGRNLYRDRCSNDCPVDRGGAGRFRGVDILEDAARRERAAP